MRFGFPKVLHKIHKFQLEGRYYVADLDCGRTIEVGEVLWDLLDLIASHSTHAIVARLGSKYKE